MLVKFKNVTTLLQQTPSGGYRTIKLQSDLVLSLEIYFRCSWTLVFYLLIRTKDGFHIPHVMPIPVDICWSSRRLQHVFSVTSFRLSRRHKDVLEDKKLLRWRRLENVLKICLEDVLKTCLEDALKTCLEDVLKTCLEDVLKTCLEDVLETNKMFTGDVYM